LQQPELNTMQTIKLRQLGNTQSLRLPEAFFIPGDEVKVYREGSRVILEPVATSWNEILEALDSLPDSDK
jgi:virulence-associated protein VagC